MLTQQQKLQGLIDLGIELNQVKDLDILMERILTQARRFVNADAGSIYIREGERLDFRYTQNATLQRRLKPGEKLVYSTFSVPLDTNSIAGYTACTGEQVNIPDVYDIGDEASFHFGKSFDETAGYRTRSMLAVPLKTVTGEVLGVLQVLNAQDERGEIIPFSSDEQLMMEHFASAASVALERAQMTRAIILRMIRMSEMRDPKETGAHVNRVGSIALELYEQWATKRGHSEEEIERNRDVLRMAAMLHDVGKVAISDVILKKPGRFTPEEFEVMKGHTIHGAKLFGEMQSDFDEVAASVALNHHERWDGKGYPGHIDLETGEALPDKRTDDGKPLGKREEEIPIFGRIVSVADVYDALCSKRVYKDAWDKDRAAEVLEQGAGTQFDPELVDIFFSCREIIDSIRARYPDQG